VIGLGSLASPAARRELLGLLSALGLSGALGCEPEEICEEDLRAQVIEERVEITIGAAQLEAELADDPSERERGWMHRVCEREAILLVPDAPGSELPVWGCALPEAVDAYFIAAGEVAAIERLDPCPEPCGSCPLTGEQLLVDAVLEVPPGALPDVELGAPVSFTLP
jgi:uncharacterized membrane protein (UPF0127 family)